MFSGPNIDFDDAALAHLLDDPKGSVGKHMRRIGVEILMGARAMVGVRTGQLRKSLKMRQGVRGRFQYVTVGADVKHAQVHHDGAKAHVIRAHQGRIMRFNVGGKVVYARKVNHPGSKPRKYLTVPMRRAVRR